MKGVINEQVVKVLVDAGATPKSAADAAMILERGGSTREASAVIVVEPPAGASA